jgi:hypothetical protein
MQRYKLDHRGVLVSGRLVARPMLTFLDALPMTREKMIAA